MNSFYFELNNDINMQLQFELFQCIQQPGKPWNRHQNYLSRIIMNRIRVIPRTAAILAAILYFLMMSSFGGIKNTFNGLADPKNIGIDAKMNLL